jgi:histidinol-phosphate aminotransferase
MNSYWSDIVRQLAPYVPGEQPQITNLIKLNTNENPYGPSPAVLAAIRSETSDRLRLYPDPNAVRLKQAIASENGLSSDQVFVGNGSDEVLAHSFLGLLKHDRPLLFADVTYSFYPVYCGLYGITYGLVPLDELYQIRVQDYFEREAGAVVIANPNAPTGCAISLDEVARLLEARSDIVVAVDEAYVDFGGESAARLVPHYPNLLVIQTMSKSRSLAGLRVGYALGQAPLIEALERVKNCFNSYPLDRLAIAGAVAALEDHDHFETTRAKVIATRARLTQKLEELRFEVLPSKANFVFVRHAGRDAQALALGLRERQILVRHFPQARIEQFLRISIGTDAQCDKLVDALREILDASHPEF